MYAGPSYGHAGRTLFQRWNPEHSFLDGCSQNTLVGFLILRGSLRVALHSRPRREWRTTLRSLAIRLSIAADDLIGEVLEDFSGVIDGGKQRYFLYASFFSQL